MFYKHHSSSGAQSIANFSSILALELLHHICFDLCLKRFVFSKKIFVLNGF